MRELERLEIQTINGGSDTLLTGILTAYLLAPVLVPVATAAVGIGVVMAGSYVWFTNRDTLPEYHTKN